jgi:hypothetical protein
VRKNSIPTGFDPRTVHPGEILYTDRLFDIVSSPMCLAVLASSWEVKFFVFILPEENLDLEEIYCT